MFKDLEVLSFEVNYQNHKIKFLEKLEHFDKAPFGVKDDEDTENKLSRFFNHRLIASQRADYQKILDATKCQNEFELSFKGHGLSLSNHYWYKRNGETLKYSDINFFENKWDDTFGRAILSNDYEKLKTCDLNVPDIVTSGWGVKAWIYDNGPKLYKLGIDYGHPEESICEVLASRCANRIFKEGEALKYELEYINGQYASVSPSIINIDEELIPMSSFLPHDLYVVFKDRNIDKKNNKLFFDRLLELGHQELCEFFVKVSCLRTLCFVSDLHFDNLSAIRNMKTGALRVAPLYDLGGAFGSSKSGKEFISNANKGTMLLIYFMFSNLDPSWDYSWYNPEKLIGFEDEIKEYLSKSDFYTPELIDCVIKIFQQQKSSLDEMIKK